MGKDKEDRSQRMKDVENILLSYRHYDPLIRELKERLGEIEKADGMGSIDYSAVRSSGTNKVSSITERMALNNIELKDKLERQIKYFELKKQSILAALEVLSKTEKLIIKKHYIEGVPMKQVEYLVGYSGASCSKKRKNALETLFGILSVNWSRR